MSLDAIAILRLTLDQLAGGLRVEDEHDEGTVFRAMGRSLEARALDDGATLHLALRFDTPAATLGSVLRRDLGELIEAHGDDRGVFVYPSVATLEATTYEAALEELGEGGMWVSIPEPEDARVGPSDALGVFQGLASGLGPDMFAQVEALLGGALGAGDDEDGDEVGPGGQLPAGLAEFAQGILANDEMRGMIEGIAGQLFGGQTEPEELMGRAREMAEKAAASNPELAFQMETMQAGLDPQQLAGLAGAMGLVQPDDAQSADDEPADDEPADDEPADDEPADDEPTE